MASSYTKERLDRAVANGEWRARFPLVRVLNGDPRHSDHRPIVVYLGERVSRGWRQPMDMLHKFEARWLEEEECSTYVEAAWLAALETGDVSLMEVQKRVLKELWAWDKDVLGELERRIKNARRELERCRRRGISQDQVNREHILRYKLERLQDQLHIYWKQRAHTAWLTKGDRNTKFFSCLCFGKEEEESYSEINRRWGRDGGRKKPKAVYC